MSYWGIGKPTLRKSFGTLKNIVPVPNLIEVQSKSFNEFAQFDYLPEERKQVGLERVLRDIFPIDYEGKMSLEYVSYEIGDWACACGGLAGIENRYKWNCTSCKKSGCSRLSADLTCPECNEKTAKYQTCSNCSSRVTIQLDLDLDEARTGGQTYSMPLRVRVQLITWDLPENGGPRTVIDIKEQEVFFADLPIMADLYESDGRILLGSQGTFLINGVERVVVSQLHRSPGVVFSASKKIKDYRGRAYYLARIIPMRGSWLDFEFDSNDCLYVRIDKKKKILATVFLQALGINREDILSTFYDLNTIVIKDGVPCLKVDSDILGQRLEPDMLPADAKIQITARRVNAQLLEKLVKAGITELGLQDVHLLNKVVAQDVIDERTGEIIVDQGQSLDETHIEKIKKLKSGEFKVIASFGYALQPTIAATLAYDHCSSQEDALKEVHAKVWPGDSIAVKDVLVRLENLLFNPRYYDLTKVGRIRMNRKLGLNVSEETTALIKEDIIATVSYLIKLRERGEGVLDDIDHLGNRRVRLVGELLSNQMYIGFTRVERIARERFRMQEAYNSAMPQDLLNVKPLSAVIREFFGTGQLSQFMDQTNPLSEIAHKRRLSALGAGGVLKDRATYEIRDVHTSHYGRICPIETPEGQTIGLISSLATYAMVNDLGFIETAYRPVKNGKVLDEVAFLDAFEESFHYIAQADSIDDHSGKLKDKLVLARNEGNFVYAEADKIDYVDCSPKQLVSVAASLIPFLEHDDATRALMGANMQRQAVPLIKCEVPITGTDMEKEIARASGAVVIANRPGVIEHVESDRIVVRVDENQFNSPEQWVSDGVDIYNLKKFRRSSYSTWIHQRPIVKIGQRIAKGDILSDGSAVESGELALGSNLLVAFMPWHGYNFEDAIVLNRRLVEDSALTSVHIDEYVVDARDTKLGPEEITRDIPNVSEGALASLDEEGLVRVGTRVKAGDILVGKVTLKGDVQYSPEERLLRAIFGEKSREVRDTSLRVPPGVEGTVVDVKVFSRSGIRKDKRYKEIVSTEQIKIENEFNFHVDLLADMITGKVIDLLDGKEISGKGAEEFAKRDKYVAELLKEASISKLLGFKTKDNKFNGKIAELKKAFENQVDILERLKQERIAKLKKGDPLPSGVIKIIKVYIASKRHISVGDKLSGRHGNKGIVSIILPCEDMPYMEDGTPVDIVLNPLGVPSRMNVGQILETILSFAGKKLGNQLAEMIKVDSFRQIRSFLVDNLGRELVDDYENKYGKEELETLAKHIAQRGVCYSVPVFDGPSFENDIKPLLRSIGMSESGAYKLRDGRTGEFFDQPVTVGMTYILKLNHLVDDKLHARSVGPYSLVTQQPLGGKAQFGGQRFGEMEVWALEAYGAAYALQELLTYKSDDVVNRHKVYEAIVRGEFDRIPEPGLPESFSVLVKELQSLGLQVDLFKSGKEEISG